MLSLYDQIENCMLLLLIYYILILIAIGAAEHYISKKIKQLLDKLGDVEEERKG